MTGTEGFEKANADEADLSFVPPLPLDSFR